MNGFNSIHEIPGQGLGSPPKLKGSLPTLPMKTELLFPRLTSFASSELSSPLPPPFCHLLGLHCPSKRHVPLPDNTPAPCRLLQPQRACWLLGKARGWAEPFLARRASGCHDNPGLGPDLGMTLGSPVTLLPLLSFSITIPVQTFSNLQIRGQ